jgi:hypothetical protein
MFVRFRYSQSGLLQVSLVEARRRNGRVEQEHIAGFGSVLLPLTVEGRLAFWQRLHERLARLSNRVDATAQGKVFASIHERIPMVTLDEQHALKLEYADQNERFWTHIRDHHRDHIEGHKQLVAGAQEKMAESQTAMAEADGEVAQVKDNIERLRNGEDAPISKPLSSKELMKIMGWNASDVRHSQVLHAIQELGEGAWKALIDARVGDKRRNRRIARRILRKYRGS